MTLSNYLSGEPTTHLHVSNLLRVLILGLILLTLYKVVTVLRWNRVVRRRYGDIPHLPRHWFHGNLLNGAEKMAPSINQHPDYAFEEIWIELGRPPAFLVDLAPVDRGMLIIADPSIAEAISQPSPEWKYSLPKSNTLQALTRLVGDHSLVLIEGEAWKIQRKRFNKGFSPSHLNTLTPMIVDKTKVFLERIKGYARDGQTFAFKGPAQDLTTDIITQLTIEKDFQAQTIPEGEGPKSRFGLLTTIKTMSSLMEKTGQGLELSSLLPQRRIKEYIYDKLYTRAIYNEIIDKLPADSTTEVSQRDTATDKGGGSPLSSSGKAIVHLALAGLKPTPAVLDSTVSQVKTFMFAGQDTTATLIQWMAYELSKSYPSSPLYSDHFRHVRERLCEEHDAVFGDDDPFNVFDVLHATDANVEEILGKKLPYTTAFIKETLRLHPPGGSARLLPLIKHDAWQLTEGRKPEEYFIDLPAWTHSKTGEHHEARRVSADGLRLYNCHYLIHRNANTWGADVALFDPARFLDLYTSAKPVDEFEDAVAVSRKTDAIHTEKTNRKDLPHPNHISTLPIGSYRPFERGPRNCIGSNLTMMEAKMVLSVIARGFEWTKIGLDGRPDGYARAVEDEKIGKAKNWEVWSINSVTAVPVDGMMMKVKLTHPKVEEQ